MRCGHGSTALSKCLFRPLGHQQPQFPFSFYFLIYWFGYCRHVRALLSMNLIPQTERVCHFPPTTFQEHRENSFIILIIIYIFFMIKLLFFYWWEIFFICSEFTSAVEKYKKRKKGKAPKRAAAWCKKDRTSLWLGAKSSLLASLAGLDEAKNKGKWKKHVCSTL